MSRRLKVQTLEKGLLEAVVIHMTAGVWEAEWRVLQGTEWEDLLSKVPHEAIEHALQGWSNPLARSLGLPPAGALRKIPKDSRDCALRQRCPLFERKRCYPASSDLPMCYEPAGVEDPALLLAAAKLIQLWREGTYVIVEENDA